MQAALPFIFVTILLDALSFGIIIPVLPKLIDHELRPASAYLILLAVFTLFGIIHSAVPDGNMYLLWTLSAPANQIPYQFTTAYVVLAVVVFTLSFTRQSRETVVWEH